MEKSSKTPSKTTNKTSEKQPKKSISDKLQELDEKTEWFYSDDFTLEQATGKYREVLTLAQDIEEDLENLQNEIELIDRDFSNE